jgi:hypothetical protein
VTPPAPLAGIPIRAVLVGDDAIFLVRRDGTVERLEAPGHPRPGLAHATATRRP